jgi:phosphate transport system substrate-binding protein
LLSNIRARTTLLAAVALILAACGGPAASPSAAPSGAPTNAPTAMGVSGDILVSGSSTVEPVSLAVSEAFRDANPDFGYTVEGPGTGDGFARFCQDETDVSDASRKIKDEEAAACTDASVTYTELKIGFDGITVMTHPDTPVDCLTFSDLYALFGPESDDFANWTDAQALATELGSTSVFPDLPLQVTAPGEESGTYDSFIEIALQKIADARPTPQEHVLRVPGPNYTASANDNVIVEGVEAGAGSLGFVGFAYYEEAGSAVKAIGIDKGDGNCVTPSSESIADGTYPLSRALYIYPNNARADANPAVQAWVDYYLSDAGIANVTGVGYVGLPADQLQATRDAWANR